MSKEQQLNKFLNDYKGSPVYIFTHKDAGWKTEMYKGGWKIVRYLRRTKSKGQFTYHFTLSSGGSFSATQPEIMAIDTHSESVKRRTAPVKRKPLVKRKTLKRKPAVRRKR